MKPLYNLVMINKSNLANLNVKFADNFANIKVHKISGVINTVISEKNDPDWHHPATSPILYPIKKIAPKFMDEDDTQNEGDPDVLVADPELTEPPMYAVVMYNDNYTSMEFVVHVLQSVFKHNVDKAVEIMLNIHNNGRGIAGIYPKDIAETKAQKVNLTARSEGYPLVTQIEPHQE